MVGAACVRPPLLLLRPLLLQRQAVARRSSRAYARHRLRHDARRPRAQRCGLGGRLLRLLAGGRRQRLAGRREAVRPRGLRGGRVVVEAEACEVVVRVLLHVAVLLPLWRTLRIAKEVDAFEVGVLLVHRRSRRLRRRLLRRCRHLLLQLRGRGWCRRRSAVDLVLGMSVGAAGNLEGRDGAEHVADHSLIIHGALLGLPAQPVVVRGRHWCIGVGEVRLRLLARLLGDLRKGLNARHLPLVVLWRRRCEGGARVAGIKQTQ
mmetsp:Transcript_91949/g.295705  ORF Transcript_91949/g.295705 Transcript_91949/m.295705 type:complete len:262 (-) Transcript_91949:231-1016(-)